MRKFWLPVAGLAAVMCMPLASPAGSAQAATESLADTGSATSQVTQPLPKCEDFSFDEDYGDAKGRACWHGQKGKGWVHDKKWDKKCVWVHMEWEMKDGATKSWDSPKACGKSTKKHFQYESPKKSVSAKAELRTG
ncbi:hypothetical protein DMH04_52340 [Kibdelosporangium aridum]|uniref:Uncharacterized protein n=1 Tax=Kibdelosporangium aridum TaxID=2030 RepID=A0A428Y8D4_KIBAR|nr:hypothetical protein [Kibdelosporangium aridum]RSM63866.1 hypothetical protein DMH04_52340 [Kibdelosporangium aridum]